LLKVFMFFSLLQVRFDLKYRDITPYYIPVINITLDFCGFVDGAESNIATRWWFDFATSRLPKASIHPCPYFGVTEFPNVYLDPTKVMISQFFMGTYLATCRFFDEEDENMLTIVHRSLLRTIHDGKSKKGDGF
jgi:hypothetical protein